MRVRKSCGINYADVKRILGENFVSPDDISQARGVNYGKKILRGFAGSLPSEEELCQLRDEGFLLIAGAPVPIMTSGIKQILEIPVRRINIGKRTFSQEEEISGVLKGVQDRVPVRWLMLRKSALLTTYKTAGEQKELIAEGEYVPNIAELMWGIGACRAVHQVKLFPHIFVRTSSVMDNYLLHIGETNDEGVSIGSFWIEYRSIILGIASARK